MALPSENSAFQCTCVYVYPFFIPSSVLRRTPGPTPCKDSAPWNPGVVVPGNFDSPS